jgi:spore coat polysaccharide biosynthesis protein SpsF
LGEITSVVIGIQARSYSKRFPRKVFELIDGQPMLRRVIDLCDRAVFYTNRYTLLSRIQATQLVLCPYKDEITKFFGKRVPILEGPEEDVLTRYKMMSDKLSPDYIVRITSDCPLLPPYLIAKHIKLAATMRYDYVSNVDEKVRTAIDGYDVEVMSRRALLFANENATDPSQREHVTQILRSSNVPSDFRRAHVSSFLNQSHIKLSVDCPDDLERVRVEYDRRKKAHDQAIAIFGRDHVHKV